VVVTAVAGEDIEEDLEAVDEEEAVVVVDEVGYIIRHHPSRMSTHHCIEVYYCNLPKKFLVI
jgi:hypothetical protein